MARVSMSRFHRVVVFRQSSLPKPFKDFHSLFPYELNQSEYTSLKYHVAYYLAPIESDVEDVPGPA